MIVLCLLMVAGIAACKGGDDDDDDVIEDLEQVSAPVFRPDGGTGDYFDVTITTGTDGAQIRYTTDGSTPISENGEIYSGSIPVYKTMTIKAVAYKDGMLDSDVSTSDLFSLNPITDTIDSDGDVLGCTSIAVDGNNIYISYFDVTNRDLKLAKSMDSGVTWNIQTVVSDGNVGQEDSSIVVDGSHIYISYWDSNNGLKFTKSTDSGVTWSNQTVDPDPEAGYYTSIALDGSNIYISYCDETNWDLKFAKSTDYGETWE